MAPHPPNFTSFQGGIIATSTVPSWEMPCRSGRLRAALPAVLGEFALPANSGTGAAMFPVNPAPGLAAGGRRPLASPARPGEGVPRPAPLRSAPPRAGKGRSPWRGTACGTAEGKGCGER